jgi:hypothetical protein
MHCTGAPAERRLYTPADGGSGGRTLAEGWSAEVSRATGGAYYFYHGADGEQHSQFEHPGFASGACAAPDGAAGALMAGTRAAEHQALLLRTQMLSGGRGVVPRERVPRERISLIHFLSCEPNASEKGIPPNHPCYAVDH